MYFSKIKLKLLHQESHGATTTVKIVKKIPEKKDKTLLSRL